MITKKEIKSIFKDRGVKTNDGSLKMIKRHLEVELDNMAVRCKKRNIKVLRINNFEFALPNPFKNQMINR